MPLTYAARLPRESSRWQAQSAKLNGYHIGGIVMNLAEFVGRETELAASGYFYRVIKAEDFLV